MKRVTILLVFIVLSSCIPLRIAPTIEGDKITLAKKFRRGLPKQYALIFEDTKDADEFYHFINTKYDLNHNDVDTNVPFIVNGKLYSFSFYEVEKPTKTLNLLPIITDAALDDHGIDPIFEDNYTTRKGHWYIVLTVVDDKMIDCLNPEHPASKDAENYLRDLRIEYFNTSNYLEAMLKEKSKNETISVD